MVLDPTLVNDVEMAIGFGFAFLLAVLIISPFFYR